MATTKRTLVWETRRPRGRDKPRGLRATLVTGVAALGCVAGFAVGLMRPATPPVPVAPAPPARDAAVATSRFLEENIQLGLAPANPADAATLRFIEENTWLAGGAGR